MTTTQQAVAIAPQAALAQDARDISNALLSRSGQALKSGDFEQFASCFAFPHEIETFAGSNLLETEEDLHQLFNAVRHKHVAMSVTDMVRHCISAEFHDDETVKATHETRLMNGRFLVQDPYPCFSVIRFLDGAWRVASSCYAIPDAHALQDAFMLGTD